MNKRVGLMSILLTLFRSNVCWAKPNHAFFYCQHSFAIFFQFAIAMPGIDIRQAHHARGTTHRRRAHRRAIAIKKALLFCCFSKSLQRRVSCAATTPRQCTAPRGTVRRLSAS
ncbi:hypothetical protein FHR47_000093 [Xanthomonas arboricola]|uniref:hypothetical protein n=1 Tax=Xanthomonas cannabis TaxID=1885674 RepID=UPI00161CEA48|nr:hypothetical protein [Xanthomonas cannabis]MBB3799868.1 hypothetical protein [Xanthomonas cannabis]